MTLQKKNPDLISRVAHLKGSTSLVKKKLIILFFT